MTERTRDDWQAAARALAIPTRAFIDGRFVDAVSGATFDCLNPATGGVLAKVAACDEADVDLAVASARRAFEAGVWSRADPAHRKAVLLKLAALLRANLEELALLETLDTGKPIRDTLAVDVPGSAGIVQWYAEAIDKLYDEVAPTAPGNLAVVRREPLGVVGAVVPWNFPLDMAVWKCAPALAAGNSVVLKPAEQSPLTALRLAELAFEAGVPAGVLNVVPGFGPTAGKAIGLHMDVDCVAFTGSTEVGKLFQIYAGQSNLKQVWMECGGKSPNLVFADCDDLDAAADMAAFGIFYNQGEICSANSRLLVERSIADVFVAKVMDRARAVRLGDPLDPATTMGALIDERHADRVTGWIEEGMRTARLACGGNRITVGESRAFVEPTIFTEVENDQPIAREEIFGPVLVVMPFDGEEEAIAVANDSVYGLAASVWTSSLKRAHRVADRLKAGTVSVNTVDALSAATPFGGFKQSGYGRDLSLHAFDKFTGLKTTWIRY